MKGCFKNNNLLSNNLNSVLFSSSSSLFLLENSINFSFPKISFLTQNFFHPNKYSLNVKRKSSISFFNLTVQLRFLLNQFSNSHTKFKKISFFKLKNSTFKFRKRKNIYFSISSVAFPQNRLEFLQNLPSFLRLYISLSKRLQWFYLLNSPISKTSYKNNILSFFFLNPNNHNSFLEDKDLIDKNNIIKLNIFFPPRRKKMVGALLKQIYFFLTNRNEKT